MPASIYSQPALIEHLARVVQASEAARAVRAVLLATRDRDHAMSVVREAAAACERPLYHFTVAGRSRFNRTRLAWDVVSTEVADPPALLRHAQDLRGGGVVVLEDCATGLDDRQGNQRMRMTLAQMLSAEHVTDGLTLVLLEPPESESRLPSMLSDRIVRLEVPYPRASELVEIARQELAAALHHARQPIDPPQVRVEAERLADGLVGLTASAARDFVRDALVADPRDLRGAAQRLQARKSSQLSRDLAMNVLDTEDTEDPIGLDFLVDYLRVQQPHLRRTGPGRARGVLLIGPPGTGKTMLARAIGRIVGLPVVEFRISALMNSYLGETERRFSQAFATLEAMAPNVVFIDEIEKAFGDSGERDGGTMMRCTGALLSWLSDNPYPNFIVATSNSLRRMGEIGLTMTRSERFDAAFFVDVPGRDARRRMLERWLGPLAPEASALACALAEQTEKFSGADLRSLVKHAQATAFHRGCPLDLDLLRQQADRKRMRAIALYDEFTELRRWGQLFCDPAGPPEA
jgi:AAA+ superfamily predicted ATPase